MTKAKRARYTLEFKLEAGRLVKGGQSAAATAKILGISEQTLHNWIKADKDGPLIGAGTKPVSLEQMEIARLRAELAWVKMERDILEKRRRTLGSRGSEVRLDRAQQRPLSDVAGLPGTGGELSRHHEHRMGLAKPRSNVSDDALLVHIWAIHAESRGEYGWPRLWKELLARSIRVGKERVRNHEQATAVTFWVRRKPPAARRIGAGV